MLESWAEGSATANESSLVEDGIRFGHGFGIYV